MNKRDDFGQKQGYWEERFLNTISKGNYINGYKEGIWRRNRLGLLEMLYLTKKGRTLNCLYIDNKSGSVTYISYINKYNIRDNITVHIEDGN